jgi:hypothetical protein
MNSVGHEAMKTSRVVRVAVVSDTRPGKPWSCQPTIRCDGIISDGAISQAASAPMITKPTSDAPTRAPRRTLFVGVLAGEREELTCRFPLIPFLVQRGSESRPGDAMIGGCRRRRNPDH